MGGRDLPEDVVETCNNSTIRRVRDFNHVNRTSGGNERDSHPHEESSAHELTDVMVGNTSSLKNDTDADFGIVSIIISQSRQREARKSS
jgi:hypothetical protein